MIYFTADCHYNHPNILRYCDRPFRDIHRMHESLIRNHNQRVTDEDDVYHIGDFCCLGKEKGELGLNLRPRAIEAQLNGKIIHIRGNHDRSNGLLRTLKVAEIFVGGKNILLIHKPPEVVENHIDLVLCGHVHNSWKLSHTKNKSGKYVQMYNVGVDVNRFMPITINEIMANISHIKKNTEKAGLND